MKTSLEQHNPILCFDWGARFIGVAFSPDRKHVFDRPALEVNSDEGGIQSMENIIRHEKVRDVVFGLPLALSGQEGRMTLRVRTIAKKLQSRVACTIFFQDERLSSRGAHVVHISQKDHVKEHSIAAEHILETFLKM